MRDTAVLFLAHQFTPAILQRFMGLQQSVAGRHDAYLLLDLSDPSVLPPWQAALVQLGLADRLVPHTAASLEAELGYPCMRQGSIVPGSAHFPVIRFWQKYPHAHCWLVEHDVWCRCPWGEFIDLLSASAADVLCSHLCTYQQAPQWYWWRSLRIPPALVPEVRERQLWPMRGFFPLYRISARALGLLHTVHQQGWQGHFEVLIPFMAQVHQLAIQDMNDLGPIYAPGSLGPKDGPAPYASLRWRPLISPSEMADPTGAPLIFHPVKAGAMSCTDQQ